jgi:hypothetical protein
MTGLWKEGVVGPVKRVNQNAKRIITSEENRGRGTYIDHPFNNFSTEIIVDTEVEWIVCDGRSGVTTGSACEV